MAERHSTIAEESEYEEHEDRTEAGDEPEHGQSPVPQDGLPDTSTNAGDSPDVPMSRFDSWIDPFPNLSIAELENLVQTSEEKNDHLKLEMDIFEHYLQRANAKHQDDMDADESTNGPAGGRRRRSRQQRGAKIVMEQIQLTVQQKCDVAAAELDDTKMNLDKVAKAHVEELCDAEAALEETMIRDGEIRKLSYDFQRDIIFGAVLEGTDKIDAEALERYFFARFAARDQLIEQLQLQDARLRVERHVRQREEAGEALHEVDFRQLQIENAQIVSKTNECNAEMLRLKLAAGNLAQVLNEHNKQLQRLKSTVQNVNDEIAARSGLLQRLVDELTGVEEQRQQAQEVNAKLRKQNESYRVAPVLDYVKEAAARHSLEREVASMRRKVEVAEGELKRVRTSRPPVDTSVRVAFGATVQRTTARGRFGM